MAKVHFSIDLQGFTDIVRAEWANNNQQQAMEFLSGMIGLSRSEKMAIINGTKKMINNPDDPDEGLLVDDDWNPYDFYLQYGGYAKPDSDLSLKTGWIADNGYFYYAAHGKHADVASKSGLSEFGAEENGWIKLTNTTAMVGITRQPNKKQKDTLFNWCTANGLNYDHVVKCVAI